MNLWLPVTYPEPSLPGMPPVGKVEMQDPSQFMEHRPSHSDTSEYKRAAHGQDEMRSSLYPLIDHRYHVPSPSSVMRFSILTAIVFYTTLASATLNWSIIRAANPTSDQADAYSRIDAAMRAAVTRYHRYTGANKTIRVYYAPGVPTAEANYNGDLRFGSNRSYMTERTAMHEISHTLGIGQTTAFNNRCAANNWPSATRLLQSWDGSSARINCGGGHIWPYGLNYDNEWSETNANRHVQLVNAMLADGL